MDNCQNCGAALPTDGGGRFCPHCGGAVHRDELGLSQTHQAVPSPVHAAAPGGYAPGYEPTRAFPAGEPMGSSYDSLAGPSGPAGPAVPQGGSPFEATQAIPATQGAPFQATQAIPVAGGDPFEAYFRPAPGERSPHTSTQVIPAIPQQPAYDQPIDYQPGPGQPYQEPYGAPYADQYDHGPEDFHKDGRNTKIAIGVAVVAVLVIIVSLITLGGSHNTAATQPSLGPTTVLKPTAAAPTTSDAAPTTSAPPTTASSSSAPAHIPGVLQMGDTGADVKWLQNRLKQLHFYNGPASGTFDQATAAAVQAFQAQAHTSDPASVVGRSTKTALIAWGSKPAMSLLGGLGGRHHSPSAGDVKRLQQALSVALGQSVPASGKYDPTTASAVASYQSAVGLLPDGVVGDGVWSALQSGKLAN